MKADTPVYPPPFRCAHALWLLPQRKKTLKVLELSEDMQWRKCLLLFQTKALDQIHRWWILTGWKHLLRFLTQTHCFTSCSFQQRAQKLQITDYSDKQSWSLTQPQDKPAASESSSQLEGTAVRRGRGSAHMQLMVSVCEWRPIKRKLSLRGWSLNSLF